MFPPRLGISFAILVAHLGPSFTGSVRSPVPIIICPIVSTTPSGRKIDIWALRHSSISARLLGEGVTGTPVEPSSRAKGEVNHGVGD